MSKFELECTLNGTSYDLLDGDSTEELSELVASGSDLKCKITTNCRELDRFVELMEKCAEGTPHEFIEILEFLQKERFDKFEENSTEVAALWYLGECEHKIRALDVENYVGDCVVYNDCTSDEDIGRYVCDNDLISEGNAQKYLDYEGYGRYIGTEYLVTDRGTIYSPNLYETGETMCPKVSNKYEVCVEDLNTGKFAWADLTECDSEEAEERLQKALDSLGNPDAYAINDTVCKLECMCEDGITIKEAASRAEFLNETFSSLDEDYIALCAAGAGNSYEHFRDLIEEDDITILEGVTSFEELGAYAIDELGADPEGWIDYETLGRDIRIEQGIMYSRYFNCGISYS